MADSQNFKNHAKVVPGYHYVAGPILFLNLIWTVYQIFRVRSFGSVVQFLLAIALILTLFYARVFALTVQDRVIRIEMQLRLQHLLPADMQPLISRLQRGQLVALRFASDAEMPALIRKVLADNITDRAAIKQMITNWQPDDLRA
jgi:hypothetical protein